MEATLEKYNSNNAQYDSHIGNIPDWKKSHVISADKGYITGNVPSPNVYVDKVNDFPKEKWVIVKDHTIKNTIYNISRSTSENEAQTDSVRGEYISDF